MVSQISNDDFLKSKHLVNTNFFYFRLRNPYIFSILFINTLTCSSIALYYLKSITLDKFVFVFYLYKNYIIMMIFKQEKCNYYAYIFF